MITKIREIIEKFKNAKTVKIKEEEKKMTKIAIRHKSGILKGDVFIYENNKTIWPDGSESSVPSGHDFNQIIADAELFEKEGNEIVIHKYYERTSR